jgi:hypothetical protein
MVSRRHLEIRRTGDGAVVEDLRSTNGTRLNRRALRAGQEAPLRPGDFLELAQERLLFHETKPALWKEALNHSLLTRFVLLRVPVLQDRTVRALGRERAIDGVSKAVVDLEEEEIRMVYSNETEARAFAIDETVFVSEVAVEEGELRLGLWGVAKGAPLKSRRAAYSHLAHGELRIGLAGDSPEEARAAFQKSWADEGMRFLIRVLLPVMEIFTEVQSAETAKKLVRGLAEQPGSLALEDAVRSLAFWSQLNPTVPEWSILAARTEARWVRAVASENRRGLDETLLSELMAALDRSKSWVRTAAELGADDKQTEEAEAEIAEAEGMLVKIP